MKDPNPPDDTPLLGGRAGEAPPPIRPVAPDFFTVSPEVARAVDAVQHEMKLERRHEAFRALVELRQRLGGFGKRVVAMVYVPRCEDCYATERQRMEADDSTWEPPDIHPKTWRKDLSEYATERDIRRTYREMKDESRAYPVVRCDTCEREILYWRDTVYVGSRPFEHHFPELVGEERNLSTTLRHLLREFTEQRPCSGLRV